MWELVSIILFGFFCARVGNVETRKTLIENGVFEFDGEIYRVSKVED